MLEFTQSFKADSDDEVLGEAEDEYNLDDVKNFYRRHSEGEPIQDSASQQVDKYNENDQNMAPIDQFEH